LSCLSKVWYPTVNRFLIRNSLPSTKRKADAKCTLCCYRRPAIFYKLSTIKARCSPNHTMVYTENGTYTAVRWRAPHHCTRSPPEGMALPNRSVLSAATCTSILRSLRLMCWIISWVVLICKRANVKTSILTDQYNPWNNSAHKSQAPEDGCINIRNMLSIK